MRKQAADPDIEVGSRVVSLKCPLSYTRIQTPCRGVGCRHNQCFDANSYLQLQEQAPTWTCPQCNKSTPWDQLVVDQYILDILSSTGKDVEQVTVEPDGRWHLDSNNTPAPTNRKRKANATPDSDDDNELIMLGDSPPIMNGTALNGQTLTPMSVRTPPINGRESSVATSHRSTSKRPRQDTHKEVIDLTLSDDDDDEEQDARPHVKSRPSMPNVFSSSSSNLNPNAPAYRARPQDSAITSTNTNHAFSRPQMAPNSSSTNRYQFQLPPPHSPHHFNFADSYGSSTTGSSSNNNLYNGTGYGPATDSRGGTGSGSTPGATRPSMY